jgi:hypothetical protein
MMSLAEGVGAKYSSTLSLTAALSDGGWSTVCHPCFSLMQEPQYSLYTRVWVSHGVGLYRCRMFEPWNIQLQQVVIPTMLSRPPAYVSMMIKSHTFQYEGRLSIISPQSAI